jgi:hypothetical protein
VATERWPSLPYEVWKDTYATLHMWTQIVGKVALARAAPVNHSWGSALQVTARGLRTAVLRHRDRFFTISFDFIDHELAIETADGERRTLPLAPRSVADFYAEVMTALNDMQLPVRIWSTPVETRRRFRSRKTQDITAMSPSSRIASSEFFFWCTAPSSTAAVSSSASAARSTFFGEASTLPSRVSRAGPRRRATAPRSCATPTRTKS